MTAEQITTIIVAVIGSGVLSAIVTSIAMRRKTSSEAEHNLANAAKILMEVAEKRIASLCERVDKLEKQVTAGIARQTELGKHQQVRARRIGLPQPCAHIPNIFFNVSHFHRLHGGRNAIKIKHGLFPLPMMGREPALCEL